MTKKKESKKPEVVEGEVIPADPAPRQIKLVTAADCKREMARVYRDARTGRLDIQDGTRLVYMLSQIGKMIELNEFEKRIELLEKVHHDNT